MKKFQQLVIPCILNAIVLIFFSFLLQKQPYLYKDEALVIQFTQLLERSLLKSTKKPPSERFLFVNTSNDNQLIDNYDHLGFPKGNQVITDRKKLASLLEFLGNSNDYEYIVCDIFFRHSSPDDSLLGLYLEDLPRTVLAYQLDDKGHPDYPIFNNNLGLAKVETVDDIFLKFELIEQDSLKSLPLVVFEEKYHTSLQKGMFFPVLNQKYILDYFFLDFRITNYDVLIEGSYTLLDLGDLLFLDEESVFQLTRERIIVIGDFVLYDTIETLIGEMAGPLIMVNAFLALEAGDNIISIGFIIFLLIAFTMISLLIFVPNDFIERYAQRVFRQKWLRSLFINSSFLMILTLISITSYFIFHIHINIFFLTIYLVILNFIVEKWFFKAGFITTKKS